MRAMTSLSATLNVATSAPKSGCPCRNVAINSSCCCLLIDFSPEEDASERRGCAAHRPAPHPKLTSGSQSLRSWVHLGAVAEVEPDGLHDPKRRAGGEHVGRCQDAGVLLDDGGRGRVADGV